MKNFLMGCLLVAFVAPDGRTLNPSVTGNPPAEFVVSALLAVAQRPGYWQKQVADDLIFACGLLQVNWHPGWMKNRRGFAFNPHLPHPYDYTPPARFWTAEKIAESVKYAG